MNQIGYKTDARGRSVRMTKAELQAFMKSAAANAKTQRITLQKEGK